MGGERLLLDRGDVRRRPELRRRGENGRADGDRGIRADVQHGDEHGRRLRGAHVDPAADLATAGELATVNGGALTFGADGTTVNGANVVCSDVVTANATVHIIDAVLLPE